MALGFAPLAALPIAAAFNETPGRLLASVGVYALTGNTVALRAARRIAAAVGSYTLTGQTLAFTVSVSQASFERVFLTATSATPIFGVRMIQNFDMVAGDHKTLVITVKDADGVAVNIASATIKWQCARSLGKASNISKATGGSGITITDAANGVFTVTLNPSDTNSLVGNFIHEAEVTSSGGTISTVLQGTMKINRPLIEAT